MIWKISCELFFPFLGTSLGALCVLFMKREMDAGLSRMLAGFAAGVMTAASFWSLLQPALDGSEALGRLAFLPPVSGFFMGVLFLLALDTFTPHLHVGSDRPEGVKSGLGRSTMLVLAVALHNVPEGMAVGSAIGGWITGSGVGEAGALALSIGIAIQNLPEGAMISLPLHASGMSRAKACALGIASGAAEPLAALATVMIAEAIAPAMPYILSFAAGAMLYVVVEELVPEMSEGEHSNAGTITFACGFALMIVLDVALG